MEEDGVVLGNGEVDEDGFINYEDFVEEDKTVGMSELQAKFVKDMKNKLKVEKGNSPLLFEPEKPLLFTGNKPDRTKYYLKAVYLLAPHLLWPKMPLICKSCNSQCNPSQWQSNPAYRHIHDLEESKYLAQYLYLCNCNNKTRKQYAIDLLDEKVKEILPFILCKATAYTKIYLSTFANMVVTALSIEETLKIMGTIKMNAYLKKRLEYSTDVDFYKAIHKKIITSTRVETCDKFSAFDDKEYYNDIPHFR